MHIYYLFLKEEYDLIIKKVESIQSDSLLNYYLIEKDYALVIWPDTITQKDINDMVLAGVEDVQTIIDNNTFTGLEARMKLATWKHI